MVNVTVIIPAYNVEHSVREAVNRCPKDYEVIVVDDGSTDGTKVVLEGSGARVVGHERNMGKGQAMVTGIENATGDIVVFMDADLQHSPEDIPRLVEKVADGTFDLVIGSRRMHDTEGMPPLRRLSNMVSTTLVRAFIGVSIKDTQSGFRAIRRESLQRMGLRSKRFEIETEMLAKAARMHLRIGEVPIKIVYLEGSKFHFSVKDIFNFVKTVIFR